MIIFKQCVSCGKVMKDEPGNFKRTCRRCGGMVFRVVKPRRKDVDKLDAMCKKGPGEVVRSAHTARGKELR
jgi:predicted  nucleic acid-binding Zn-ribbon protein